MIARGYLRFGLHVLLASTMLAGVRIAPASAQQAGGLDLATFPYFPQRSSPGAPGDPYGSLIDRPSLAAGTPNATLLEFNANWGNRAIGQGAALTATETRNGMPVDGLTGRGVTVAVIDSGIDARFQTANPAEGFSGVHPEFLNRLDIRSRAFIENEGSSLDIFDRDGHGTHVAGTVGAARDGVGMMGVAPEANLLVLKGIGAKTETASFDSTSALVYAASLPDVRVVNGSYGPMIPKGSTIWNTEQGGASLDREYRAVYAALAAGKVLVYANGNDGIDSPIQARNPSGVPLFPFIRPANARSGVYNDAGKNYDFSALASLPGSIVAVANLDASLTISPNSNRCGVTARWCVSAPGGGEGSGAEGILSAYPRTLPGLPGLPAGTNYVYEAGTSMAAPHVAGALAVLFQAYPTYLALDIVRLLFATAQDLGAKGIDDVYGHGLIRLDRALSAPLIDPNAAANSESLGAGETRYWSAPFTAAGSLVVTGASREPGNGSELVVAGRTTVRGAVRAESVDIEVDGTLTTPHLTIATNASLSGEGDIFGNVDVRGLFSPGSGNSGDLVIHGNLSMAKGSAFLAFLDGSDHEEAGIGYSLAVVTGVGNTFTAGGHLVFDMVGMPAGTVVVPLGSKIPVVLAENGARILGRFESIEVTSENGATGLPDASRIDLLYRPDAIVGAVTPAAYARLEANGVAMTGRQRAVGGALDRARGAPGDPMSERALDLFDPLFDLSAQALPRAFDQLSGAGSSASAQASVEDARRFGGVIGQRLAAVRGGTAGVQAGFAPNLGTVESGTGGLFVSPTNLLPTRFAALDGEAAAGLAPIQRAGAGVWGLGFGSGFRIGQDASGPGLRAQGGGIALGVDRAVDAEFVLGGAIGYARSGVSSAGVRGNADTYLGAAYLGFQRGGLEVDASAGLAYAILDTVRTFQPFGTPLTARQKADGLGALASVETGYRVAIPTSAGRLDVKPLVGFAYHDLHRGAFTETGRFGLGFAAQTFGRATTLVGARTGLDLVGADGLRFRPELRIGWTHDLLQASPFGTAALLDQPFLARDARPGRDGALIEASLSVWSSESVSVFAGFRGEYRAQGASHQGHAGLRLAW